MARQRVEEQEATDRTSSIKALTLKTKRSKGEHLDTHLWSRRWLLEPLIVAIIDLITIINRLHRLSINLRILRWELLHRVHRNASCERNQIVGKWKSLVYDFVGAGRRDKDLIGLCRSLDRGCNFGCRDGGDRIVREVIEGFVCNDVGSGGVLRSQGGSLTGIKELERG